MMSDYSEKLDQAIHFIQKAKYIIAFTGAGISTPSGIADFRSPTNGLWTKSDPMKVASLTTFRKNPQYFYQWLRPLAIDVNNAMPNPAHLGLAALETKGILKAVITQNIDGLHQRAGSRKVIELHGSMDRFVCPACQKVYTSDQMTSFTFEDSIPHCLDCQSILKPDIILFEEMLPKGAWDEAQRQCRLCDLMIVMGSSLSVYPAASIPETALTDGKKVILVNLMPTPLDDEMGLVLTEDVAKVVPDLLNQYFPHTTAPNQ